MSMYPQDPNQGPSYQQYQGQPYQQSPYYPNNQYYGQPPAPQKNNIMSILGFIFAILGIVFWWIPFFGALMAIAGVVLSGIALSRRELKGLSIAGVGGVAVIIAILWTILYIASVASHNSSTTSYNAAASVSSSVVSEQAPSI
ncbi:hypothetical protein [Curtobacterium sp. S6]|uniref:hypothetical protein n=1 Tax=Curtobacterium sp. S6 TaxID=1479623 RepID=UPI000569A836|nr:hypothetical protein [Curtobacterium sp. S6]